MGAAFPEKHSHANLTGKQCSPLQTAPGRFRGAARFSLPPAAAGAPRRGGQGVAAGHILRCHVVAVGLRVRCILPHSGRGAAGSAAAAADGCQRGAGGQRRMRGLCGAGRGGGAVRLLRLPERARCLGLGAAAAVCRGGVPPAAASFQPRGAPFTFAAARQGVCAATARQRYGMQYAGRPRPAGFPSAAGRAAAGFGLSLRSSLQGPAKHL